MNLYILILIVPLDIWIVYFLTMFGKVGGLFIAIAVYSGVLTTMVWVAFSLSNWMIVLGASLFAFSDVTLAFNKFYTEILYQHFIILFTYWAGQMLIMFGWIEMSRGGWAGLDEMGKKLVEDGKKKVEKMVNRIVKEGDKSMMKMKKEE